MDQAFREHIGTELRRGAYTVGGIDRVMAATGGCINDTAILVSGEKDFFVKWNSREAFPMMFEKEFRALERLRDSCSLTIPQPLLVGEFEEDSYLVMECITGGRRNENYWEELGRGLAKLHRQSALEFGWEEHNFIGSLPQYNDANRDWPEFFVENRINKPLQMAVDAGILGSDDIRLCDSANRIFLELLKGPENPAMIHGDLWSGNLMVDRNGLPCLIDPAIYFANREIEIAFTTLFGRFGEGFYDAYQEVFQMESGFENRFEVYNLYPLLVHANLFGGAYVGSYRQLIKKYN